MLDRLVFLLIFAMILLGSVVGLPLIWKDGRKKTVFMLIVLIGTFFIYEANYFLSHSSF